jgi:hypothetical protein
MVRRFDEVLVLKAGKNQMDEEIVNSHLVTDGKFNKAGERMMLIEADIALNKKRFQEFVQVVNSNIYDAVLKVSKKMKGE